MADDPKPPGIDFARAGGFSGFPVFGRRSYPGSDEYHRELNGTQADRKYREILDNHGLTGTTFRLVSALAQQVQYTVEPARKDDAAADAAAELVRAEIARLPWRQIVAEMISALPLGWSWHEVVYRRDGRRWGWEGIEFRRQDSRLDWIWSADSRRVEALQQLTRSGQHAIIPAARSVHFVPDTTTGDPEGRPILRGVYCDYRDLWQVRTSTLIALQKDATGLLVARVPLDTYAGAAAGDTAAVATLTAVKADAAAFQRGEREGLVMPAKTDAQGMPTGWDVELLKGGGDRQIDHVELWKTLQSSIAVTLLTQFLVLGQGRSGGSFALAAEQTDMLGVALGGALDLLCEAFTKQAIIPLCGLNGIPEADAPTLAHGPIDGPDLAALATLLKTSIEAGILKPDAALEAHVRDIADLPRRPVADTADAPGAPPIPNATAPDQPVAAQALNGIQISALRETLAAVTSGETTPELARLVIAASFPTFTPEQIDAMIAAAGAPR